MNTTLAPAEISSYRENGFVHHPGLLSDAEVTQLRTNVLETIAGMGRKKLVGGADLQEGDSYYDKVFTQRLNLWRLNPIIKDYMLDPGLGRMLCALGNVPGYRIWHDQALIKEPFGNPTAWHLDNPFWSFSSRESISVWIALEDATLGNGCMWFIPGTQRLARFENADIGQNMAGLFEVYSEMGEIDPVAVPMKAGDCSFHNGLCAHGAGANMTRGRRIAMTCAYMPVGSKFNGQRNVLPEPYFSSLKRGDVLANDDWNPIVPV